MARSETFDFAGPAGCLESVLMETEGPARAAGVVCHADPLQGGMMHFKVVFRAAKALRDHAVPALRFNFRGVGRSEGHHDDGRGEQADVVAALDEIERRYPNVPLILGGFSFGAAMALSVATREPRLRAVFALGFPITRVEPTTYGKLSELRVPLLFVQGERDIFGSGDAVRALASGLPVSPRVEIVAGADHFFTGKLDEVESALSRWITSRPWESAA
jgi:hypothetical protein